ncbi:S1 family peptidase [Saccharothrix coeruleofusca]|uniref:Serine protease n=1 Tax=Saccharothrix coeruleofusca TaxID=33919 RepID=A0A918EC88_9PSEU|nr:serine protease [Saccharothrix coeruleofusca]MBP2338467.1 secreted trypsin-like serine protease [Saccharothrix coeruleofusca]GGP48197.1 serine protease [Saccharothrix coeruleofusca]
MRLVALVLVLFALGGGTAAADDPRIVGGQRVSIGDHPWVVYLADPSGYQFCGGTIVAPRKVLTAGHCAAGLTARATRVVAGREDKQSRRGVVVAVTDIWVHPRYITADRGDDLAVLTLAEALPYQPLPLADRDYPAGTRATILGWGRTGEQGAPSRYLLGASVPLVSDENCAKAYPQYDERSMVCAGYERGGVDTCQGDSGGPLVVGGALVGVTSWGEGCARAGKPGVYTLVRAYLGELAEQIGARSPALR